MNIDTPAFDGEALLETDISVDLLAWLASKYPYKRTLAGLIYLHQVKDNRRPGSRLRNLRLLRQFIGEDTKSKVILTSTGWNPRSISSRLLGLSGILLPILYILRHGAHMISYISSTSLVLNAKGDTNLQRLPLDYMSNIYS